MSSENHGHFCGVTKQRSEHLERCSRSIHLNALYQTTVKSVTVTESSKLINIVTTAWIVHRFYYQSYLSINQLNVTWRMMKQTNTRTVSAWNSATDYHVFDTLHFFFFFSASSSFSCSISAINLSISSVSSIWKKHKYFHKFTHQHNYIQKNLRAHWSSLLSKLTKLQDHDLTLPVLIFKAVKDFASATVTAS